MNSARVAEFVAKRRKERGKKPNSKVSPATINSHLRHIKAALRVAVEWGCLDAMPKIKFAREPERLPRFVTQEHFALIYTGCDVAKFPNETSYPPADWWRGLLVMAQMTGWRKGDLLCLEWEDVDLDRGTAMTRVRDNIREAG